MNYENNNSYYNYFIGWLRRRFKNPEKKDRVGLVFIGEQDIGKSYLMNIICLF
jgi:hypothetical protein